MQLELCWACGGDEGQESICPWEMLVHSWREHLTDEHKVAGSIPIDQTSLFYFTAITHSYSLDVVSCIQNRWLWSQVRLKEASPGHQFNSIIKN